MVDEDALSSSDWKVVVKAGARTVCDTGVKDGTNNPTWNTKCAAFTANDKSLVQFAFYEECTGLCRKHSLEGIATYRLDDAATAGSSVADQKVVTLTNPKMPPKAGKSFTFSYHMLCSTTPAPPTPAPQTPAPTPPPPTPPPNPTPPGARAAYCPATATPTRPHPRS